MSAKKAVKKSAPRKLAKKIASKKASSKKAAPVQDKKPLKPRRGSSRLAVVEKTVLPERRSFSKADKAAALSRLAERSTDHAAIRNTARELEINEKTLFAWSRGRGISQEVLRLVEQQKKTVADTYEEISVLANMRLIERLGDEALAAKIPARDFAVISGTATDKARLLREKPTSITENRQLLRPEAEKALAEYQEFVGSREEALKLLQEDDPELASALIQ